MAAFSLIVVGSACMYINTTCLDCILILLRMFLGLIIWCWITSCIFFPGEDCFFYSLSDIFRRHNLTTNFPLLWIPQSFCSFFLNDLWAVGAGIVLWCLSGCWASQDLLFSTFWMVVVFCSGLCCKKKFLWWEVIISLICGYKDKNSECT